MSYGLRKRTLTAAAAVGLVLAACPCVCQFLFRESSPNSGSVEMVRGAQIDWGNGFYQATGQGVVPPQSEEPNRSKAYLKARGYGKMKAAANLLAAVEGTVVSHESLGRDYIARDTALGREVEEHLAGAQIAGEKQQVENGETVVEVTVRSPMYGARGVASAILRSKFDDEPEAGADHHVAVNKRGSAAVSSVPREARGPFTALIVDCSGLEIERALSPCVRRADGSEVWGMLGSDHDFLRDCGIVTYTQTLAEAKRSKRAGGNPLVLRAIGAAGSRFMCDPVISYPDAEVAIRENHNSHFLDRFDVIFVVDSK